MFDPLQADITSFMTATLPGRTSSHTGITDPSVVSVCKRSLISNVIEQAVRQARVAHTFRRMNGAQKQRHLANAPPEFPDALQKFHHSLATQSEVSGSSERRADLSYSVGRTVPSLDSTAPHSHRQSAPHVT